MVSEDTFREALRLIREATDAEHEEVADAIRHRYGWAALQTPPRFEPLRVDVPIVRPDTGAGVIK